MPNSNNTRRQSYIRVTGRQKMYRQKAPVFRAWLRLTLTRCRQWGRRLSAVAGVAISAPAFFCIGNNASTGTSPDCRTWRSAEPAETTSPSSASVALPAQQVSQSSQSLIHTRYTRLCLTDSVLKYIAIVCLLVYSLNPDFQVEPLS